MAKKDKDQIQKIINIHNRKASHEYHFIDKYVAGIVLKGTEIKSIRMGKVNMYRGRIRVGAFPYCQV